MLGNLLTSAGDVLEKHDMLGERACAVRAESEGWLMGYAYRC